jgi:hypothetical protein
LAYLNFEGLSVSDKREPLEQDAQKGRSARPQRMKKAEVEVKVKHRTGSCLLNLSLSLNLPITLADFFSILQESLVA